MVAFVALSAGLFLARTDKVQAWDPACGYIILPCEPQFVGTLGVAAFCYDGNMDCYDWGFGNCCADYCAENGEVVNTNWCDANQMACVCVPS